MIITVPAAAKEVAPYQGIQLGSMWYISLDYINHQTSLTPIRPRPTRTACCDSWSASAIPGSRLAQECTGHQRGYLQLRWQRLSRDLTPADGPSVQLVPVAELAKHLPFYEQQAITKAEYTHRIAARQAAVATECSAN